MSKRDTYELVVGLEIHIQLKTRSKAFCSDEVSYGASPNSLVSPVSLGHPGTLPVHNLAAVEKSIMLGLACHSDIRKYNSYSRKNYFYADLPKGYQITQFDTPLCNRGFVDLELSDGSVKRINLTRIHMEEDTGKSIHDLDMENSLLDYNRAGTALVEMVTEPDFRSEEEAYVFLSEIRKLVRYLDICDGNMEEGSLRCDANVSVRKKGATGFGTKVEVKNMNSMTNVKKAIEHEFERQVKALEEGVEILGETRNFDALSGQTISMRSKESVNDYRYFPEPDLPPLVVGEEWTAKIRAAMPPLPKELYQRFTSELGLGDYDARVLTEQREIAEFYLEVTKHTKNYKAAANWTMGPVKTWLNNKAVHISGFPLSAATISAIIASIDEGIINNSQAEQRLFPALLEQPAMSVEAMIAKLNIAQTGDDEVLLKLVHEVIAENPAKVEEYRSGKTGLLAMFMGQIMKKSQGKADPRKTSELLKQKLDA